MLAKSEFLLFQDAAGRWALPTKLVERVFDLDNLTTLPLTPSILMGLTNYHGEALVVLDLAALNLPDTGMPYFRHLQAILVEAAGQRFSIAASEIHKIVTADVDDLQPCVTPISRFTLSQPGPTVTVVDVDQLLRLTEGQIRREMRHAGVRVDEPGEPDRI